MREISWGVDKSDVHEKHHKSGIGKHEFEKYKNLWSFTKLYDRGKDGLEVTPFRFNIRCFAIKAYC